MKDLKLIRTEIAKGVLERMVGDPVYWVQAYVDRPVEMSNMGPEQYAAKVAVRFADALVEELYFSEE